MKTGRAGNALHMASASRKTIWYALVANAVIALAKGVAGVVTGSAAVLAEAAHSLADTTNQVLLLVSLSLGRRPPDEEHPFGHGKERFFWAFLVAVMIFALGGIFSVANGVWRLLGGGGEDERFLVGYAVLGVALLAEGVSLVRAVRQTRADAREEGLPYRRFLRWTTEPASKTVVFEDSAAVLGILIAFAGLGLHQLTGQAYWDGLAAIAIGVLLLAVGFLLGRDSRALLLGEGARPEQRQALRESIESHAEVDEVLQLLTMYLGPENLLVAARLELGDVSSADEVEDLADRIEAALREVEPSVTQVFVDPTPGPGRR